MKITKPKENWTKFPNCILDNLDKFDAFEFKILGLMVRKNLGYENPNCQFSINYLVLKLNIGRTKVSESLKSLESKSAIQVIGTGSRGIKLYNVNWHDPDYVATRTSPSNDTVLGRETTTLKENNSKRKHTSKSKDLRQDSEAIKIKELVFQHLGQTMNISSNEWKPILGFVKGQTFEKVERAMMQASKEKDVDYTWHSLLYGVKGKSNIDMLNKKYRKQKPVNGYDIEKEREYGERQLNEALALMDANG